MKIKLLILITLLSFSNAFGQSFEKLLYSKKDQATYLINENIIANLDVMKQIPSDKMLQVYVMKSPQKGIDHYAKDYPNLSEYGLILCKTNLENIAAKSQNEIREFLGTDSKTKIYVDGFLIMNEHYRIATQSINEIEFIKPNERDLNEEKIINVWTLPKEIRLGPVYLQRHRLQKEKNGQ